MHLGAAHPSPSYSAGLPAERRSVPRVRTVFFLAKVTRESDAGLFRVKNISDKGLSLIAHVGLRSGERVLVELSPSVLVGASVVWCKGDTCGLVFHEPIDSTAFLKDLFRMKREDLRSELRLPVHRKAVSYSQAGIHPVTITDVSPRGVGLKHDGSLRAGMLMKLVVESGATRSGAICWSHNGYAGAHLSEPFALDELESARGL